MLFNTIHSQNELIHKKSQQSVIRQNFFQLKDCRIFYIKTFKTMGSAVIYLINSELSVESILSSYIISKNIKYENGIE